MSEEEFQRKIKWTGIFCIIVGILFVISFILSILGVKIGNKFGERYERKSEIAGGVILILIGTKILLEHLGFIV